MEMKDRQNGCLGERVEREVTEKEEGSLKVSEKVGGFEEGGEVSCWKEGE